MNDPRVKSHIEPILSSPILIKEGNRPCRIVLYQDNRRSQYIVHTELLRPITPKEGHSCGFEHDGFHQGGYYDYKSEDRQFLRTTQDEALHYAQVEYNERARKLLEFKG